MKVGFIGVGGIAQPHLETVSQMDGVQVVGVCDIVEARAQEVAQKYRATAYTDYHAMLSGETLDACYVCVIPGAHGNIELDLAKAGIPFYAEKPVHLDLDACERVIQAIEAGNVINSVGYHWRYTVPVREAKAWVDNHRISLIEGWWYGGFVGVPWWRQMKLSGGQLVEQTTHIVDMARFIGGEVDSVYAAGSMGAMSEIENYDIHDTSVATLRFDSGAIGQITSGCIAEEHGGDKIAITVKGRDWMAEISTNHAKLSDATGNHEIAGDQSHGEQLGNGDRAFIAAIRANDMSGVMSPYISGAQTLAVTLAANESMQSGQSVKVRRFV